LVQAPYPGSLPVPPQPWALRRPINDLIKLRRGQGAD
jgi:hypothetical protein